MVYPEEKTLQMQSLRATGHSIPEISSLLSVSKSTVLRHISDVEILPQYYDRWLNRKKTAKKLLERNLLTAQIQARKWIDNISDKESIIIASMLYWAEGSKKDFSISNTNPDLIYTFINAMRRSFKLNNKDFKVSLRLYEDLNITECLEYWSKITEIYLDNSTSINILKGSRKGKLKYGMCRIRIKKSGIIHKTLFAIANLTKENISPHSLVDKTKDS